MATIRIYRANGQGDVIIARGQTLESAIVNGGRKHGQIGRNAYAGIGNLQHFEGGHTYHVQFGRYHKKYCGTMLGDTFVVQDISRVIKVK